MFRRKIETVLYDNYKDKESKIIMIDGARQIGKSFIIEQVHLVILKTMLKQI